MTRGIDRSEHCWEDAIHGEPPPEVARHLEVCVDCALRVEAMRGMIQASRARIPPPPAGLEGRIADRLQERETQGRGQDSAWVRGRRIARVATSRGLVIAAAAGPSAGRRSRRPVLAILALALILAVVATPLLRPPGQPGAPDLAVASVKEYKLTPDCHSLARKAVSSQGSRGPLTGQRVEVAGVWTGQEYARFRKVLAGFAKATGIEVTYLYEPHEPREIAKTIRARLDLDCPPDLALLPQRGLLADLAHRGDLAPIAKVVGNRANNYSGSWQRLGRVGKTLYGVWFKAANKSTIWFDPGRFRQAGIGKAPKTWQGLKRVAAALAKRGIKPFSVAGYSGWTLTDWFENVYLRTAGPQKYDELAEHRIPWTDQSVKDALRTLREIWGKEDWLVPRSLYTNYEQSVTQVFSERKAAMVYEGSFVRSVIPTRSRSTAGPSAGVFGFPAIGGQSGVVIGGDVAVLFKKHANDEAAKKLIQYLATPQAAKPWAQSGGFVSPNTKFPLNQYPDPTTRRLAKAIVKAKTVRFDLSDLVPPAFGGSEGVGMREILRSYLKDPGNIDVVTQRLEAAAKYADGLEKTTARPGEAPGHATTRPR